MTRTNLVYAVHLILSMIHHVQNDIRKNIVDQFCIDSFPKSAVTKLVKIVEDCA